jgi:hypothetical protein
MDRLRTAIQADEAKLVEYQKEIRAHEQRIASIRQAMRIVEARRNRLRARLSLGHFKTLLESRP